MKKLLIILGLILLSLIIKGLWNCNNSPWKNEIEAVIGKGDLPIPSLIIQCMVKAPYE